MPAQAVLLDGRKSSSAALAQLAWTGLSSSELAALISRLNMQAYSPERAALVADRHLGRKAGSEDGHFSSLLKLCLRIILARFILDLFTWSRART